VSEYSINFVRRNLMAISSCSKMHDHGFLRVSWRYSPSKNPLAVSIRPCTSDNFVWELPLDELVDIITDGMKVGVKYSIGIADVRRRVSVPSALAMRFPTPMDPEIMIENDIPSYVYLMFNLLDVQAVLGEARKISCDVDIDSLINKIFS
jgi:hypothetical protein